MIFFSPIQVIRDNCVAIPYYIRAALGLHNRQQMHISVFETSTEESLLTELIASPIPLSLRSDLWIMRASFYDRPGLMAELTSLLKKLHIDIVLCNGITSEHNKYCHMELVLDNQYYLSDYDGDSQHRAANEILTLKGLKAKIMAYFIEDVIFSHNDKPLITIYRNIPLYRSSSKNRLLDRDIVQLLDGRILLSKEILQTIEQKYLNIYPEIKKLSSEKRRPLATIVADPENALLRMLLFYRNTGHLHIRVEAKNLVGTLAAITTRLYNAKFNIYQLYTRNKESPSSYSLTDLLIRLPSELDKFRSDNRLKKFVKGIFNEEHLKSYEIKVSFPKFLSEDSI